MWLNLFASDETEPGVGKVVTEAPLPPQRHLEGQTEAIPSGLYSSMHGPPIELPTTNSSEVSIPIPSPTMW